MKLRKTIMLAHKSLSRAGIDHALIGGIALATLGLNRATADVDLIIEGEDKDNAIRALTRNGFELKLGTLNVLHFQGPGYLDILLANKPLSKEMLKNASVRSKLPLKCLQPEDIIGLKIQAYKNDHKREFQDKSDILKLIELYNNMDWNKIRKYAELFNEWDFIEKLRKKL